MIGTLISGPKTVMPLTYDIAPAGDHLRIVGSGPLTTADLVATIRLVTSDRRWLLYASALVDLRATTYKHKDQAEIITVAAALEAFRFALKGRIAIVAGPDISFFAEIFAVHVRQTTDIPIKVFVDLPAAEKYCRQHRDAPPQPNTASPKPSNLSVLLPPKAPPHPRRAATGALATP
jgi:hypothetical protein